MSSEIIKIKLNPRALREFKMGRVYVVLHCRGGVGFHWGAYDVDEEVYYHITNRRGGWEKEIKYGYNINASRNAAVSKYEDTYNDFDERFNNEDIYSTDTCRTFILRLVGRGVGSSFESECISHAEDIQPQIEQGIGGVRWIH